jgi:uncharacterized membrane-anchored protein YhcB (DUF1043 family)
MTDTALLATVGLVALLLGAGLGYYLAARRERQADERAATAEAELGAYRDNVTDHFRETAVHFRALGEQYRSLHEHLAQGAESLCETRRDDERLSFSPLAEIEGPAAGAGEEPAALEPEGAVIESATDDAASQAAAAADATSRIKPPVDYELPGAAAPAAAAPVAGDVDEAREKGTEAAAHAEASPEADETRPDEASASSDAEPAQAEESPRKAEGDEADVAATPVEPDPARTKDEASSRTIH